MALRVEVTAEGQRLAGGDEDVDVVNRFLAHLAGRNFSAATRRAYAYDLLNFLRFCEVARLGLCEVRASDVFDYVDWQSRPRSSAGQVVVQLKDRAGAAPATMNRRIAAVRGLFEYAVLCELRSDNPVPVGRRGRAVERRRGLLGHLNAPHKRTGGRLIVEPRLLPEALDLSDVAAFVADLATARDRAMTLGMLLGGLRSAEIRSLRLADVDFGLRRVRVVGKGGRERVVPVEADFFHETSRYLRGERPAGCSTPECFVVLRGPTRGEPMTEAGLRRIFRTHRSRAETPRVRPHRLRHTYGTELATAGIDLLVLRDLMGHASPETTARYVHLSVETLGAEYSQARQRAEQLRS
ncbi:MAG: tyrosine-type recombinase/integrase [Kribbellaceae bacterium]